MRGRAPVVASQAHDAGRAPRSAPRWRLRPRQLCDLELLGSGGFAPLRTFLGRADYDAVCDRMRLADGRLWPVPVTLDLPEEVIRDAERAGAVVLADEEGDLAVLTLAEIWRPDRLGEAAAVLGTTDRAHPSVAYLVEQTHPWYVSGPLQVLRMPGHPGLPPLVHSPAHVRAELARRGWTQVVAFNTRNPMHGAHRAVAVRAAEQEGAHLLLHPVVGPTRPGDVPAPVRVRCYEAVMRTFPPGLAMLSLLPLAMRMAGPREALWHALVRRNYGATGFVVGRDQASPGVDSHGRPFYDVYAAQELVRAHEHEIGIRAVCSPELVHVEGLGYLPRDEVPAGMRPRDVSGTRVRQLLAKGAPIPDWLAPPEVVAELASAGEQALPS